MRLTLEYQLNNITNNIRVDFYSYPKECSTCYTDVRFPFASW